MEIIKAVGGYVMVEDGKVVVCQSLEELHRELEMAFGKDPQPLPELPEPPRPPTQKAPPEQPRQFDDED